MRRRILITGSSGRLGGALTRHLASIAEIVQLDALEPSLPEQRELGPIFQGSILDRALLGEAMEGVDTVIHCAAYPGAVRPFDTLMETNTLGTFSVLEEAGAQDSVSQFIFASSIQWHGLQEEFGQRQSPEFLPITEAHPSLATGYYDTSKVVAEHLCKVYSQRFRKSCVAIRPGWIIAEEVEATFHAMDPPEHTHLNDYVGASDLVEGVRLLLDYEPEDGFEAFLFHADDQRSTLPSVELAERYFPDVQFDRAKLNAEDGFGALVDCSRAKERLGWAPKFRCRR